MGSDFDSFNESPLGAFFQSALHERGEPQGPVRLIGVNAGGTGQAGSAIHTSGTKSYILGSQETGGVVLLKYARPASNNAGLGSLDWQKKIALSVNPLCWLNQL